MSDGRDSDVAVLIPARNEAASIVRCLEHVLAQDLDRELLEVIVIDGDSDDGTGEIARAALKGAGLSRWVVHGNPGGSTPSNLNAGLALVRAPVVCRVDARSLIPPHYVRTCADVLSARPEVVVVGGAQVAVPRSETARDRGIARALNNRFGMGFSRYRRGARSGPSDTVYLGAFRTADLRRAGGWNERFGTNQDFELNRRMSQHGLVWFDDSLQVGYLPRASVAALWAQYHRFGRWKARYWRESGDRPQRRQLVLLALPPIGLSAVVLAARRRPLITAVSAVAGVALLEAVGAGRRERASIASQSASVVSLAAVGLGWWTGVIRGLVRPDRAS